MNLHFHLTSGLGRLALRNLTWWSTEYRPMGGILLAGIYRLFGFHPLPFRVVCFALLAANLVPLYQVCVKLAQSREAALLAVLLGSYHALLVDLYYSSGTVYELLCYGFYLAAFLWYISIREEGRVPSLSQWAGMLALYVAALGSKELGVTLPMALGCYELIWHPPMPGWAGLRQWIWNEGRGMLLTGLLTVPYVIGKLTAPGSLTENPAYRPTISLSRYFGTFRLYLDVIFYQDHFFRPFPAVALIAAMLGLALAWRSRAMVFAWWFVLFSVLPFIFIPHYSGFFIYLPLVGWTLYAGTALALARRKLATGIPAWALFLTVAAVLAPLHARASRKSMAVFESARLPTSEAIAGLGRARIALARGAHVYFESDPFPPGGYSLLFLMEEFYDDRTVDVRRAKDGVPRESAHWNIVMAWRDGDWVSRPVRE